jgi:protein-disulfide isomerase-like protein with CxxC motif
MTEPVSFHFDPLCPWCWQTSCWMRRLVELGAAEVTWGVFSLEITNHADGADGVEHDARGVRGLRTAILVRDRHGNDAMGAFYAALGHRHFDLVESYTEADTFRRALADIDLDPELHDQAMARSSTWTTLVREHKRLVRETQAFGVPTIRLDGGRGPVMFGPVVSRLPTDDDALGLFERFVWLTRYENFSELKRARTVPLDTERSRRWERERARKAAADARAQRAAR